MGIREHMSKALNTNEDIYSSGTTGRVHREMSWDAADCERLSDETRFRKMNRVMDSLFRRIRLFFSNFSSNGIGFT